MASVQNPSTWPQFADIDPEYKETITAMGGAPNLAAFPTVQALRKMFEDSKKAASDSMETVPGVKEEDRQIPMRDGHQITVRIYTPETKPAGGSPFAVVFHGGGWCIGGLTNEEPLCRLMVSNFGSVVVNVDYRLGPEFKFPTGQHDGYDALKWAAENATSLGADPSQGFTIHGTSAGGNIGCTAAHLWTEEKMSPPLTGLHLMVPFLCDADAFPDKYKADWKAYDQLIDRDDVVLNRDGHNFFLSNYIPSKADRANPLFSPFLFDHKGQPPHYFQICGMDALRDDELIYDKVLREEYGVKTKVDVYQGVPHGFWSMFPKLGQSKTFHKDSVVGVKWLLEQK